MINLSMPVTKQDLQPRITVIGVGGAGGNAVNNMISAAPGRRASSSSPTPTRRRWRSRSADRRIQLGIAITQGLGAGARPEVGRAAAEEALDEILEQLSTAPTWCSSPPAWAAAPAPARRRSSPRAAREQGILTVGVVTKPFHFEGAHRMRLAEQRHRRAAAVRRHADRHPEPEPVPDRQRATTFADAFKMADDVLHIGRARRHRPDGHAGPDQPRLRRHPHGDERDGQGDDGHRRGRGRDARAIDAAEAAISNPLLDDVSMKGARGVLINITGGLDMTLFEVDEAANRIREEVDPDANIIFGSTFDETLAGPHARLGGRHRHRRREDRPAASRHRDRSPERGRRRPQGDVARSRLRPACRPRRVSRPTTTTPWSPRPRIRVPRRGMPRPPTPPTATFRRASRPKLTRSRATRSSMQGHTTVGNTVRTFVEQPQHHVEQAPVNYCSAAGAGRSARTGGRASADAASGSRVRRSPACP